MQRSWGRDRPEIGLDEAGRGCLAGPVTAGAVWLWPGKRCPSGLTDSKAVSPAKRTALRHWIEAEALAWGVGWCSPAEIDDLNILQASVKAMHRAVEALVSQLAERRKLDARVQSLPTTYWALSPRLLVDGHYFRPVQGLEHRCERRGDARFRHIAAASILAKTHRDEEMRRLAEQYPGYGWASNKGYPSIDHRRALGNLGPSDVHRRSFRLEY